MESTLTPNVEQFAPEGGIGAQTSGGAVGPGAMAGNEGGGSTLFQTILSSEPAPGPEQLGQEQLGQEPGQPPGYVTPSGQAPVMYPDTSQQAPQDDVISRLLARSRTGKWAGQ